MNTCKLLLVFLFSQTLYAGEWSIQFQNRETGDNPVFQVPKTDYFFPQRVNNEWQCLLGKEYTTLTDQGLPALGRVLACTTKDWEFIGGTIVCDNFYFETKDNNDHHIVMPEPCVDEIELRELGPTAPNIKVVVRYEWWK